MMCGSPARQGHSLTVAVLAGVANVGLRNTRTGEEDSLRDAGKSSISSFSSASRFSIRGGKGILSSIVAQGKGPYPRLVVPGTIGDLSSPTTTEHNWETLRWIGGHPPPSHVYLDTSHTTAVLRDDECQLL